MLNFQGYGTFSPETISGKLLTIIIASFGIPLNIFFLAQIGEFLKNLCIRVFSPLKKYTKNERRHMVLQVVNF
jgi:hypothetical protein